MTSSDNVVPTAAKSESPADSFFVRLARSVRGRLLHDFNTGARLSTVLGIVGCWLLAALLSSFVRSAAPVVELVAPNPDRTVTGLHWFDDSASVAVGLVGMQPVSAYPDGRLMEQRSPPRLVADRFAQVGGRKDLRPAVQALAGLTGRDGEFLIRVQPNEVVAPGGLVAIDGSGYLFVPGVTVDGSPVSFPRRRVATQADSTSIWQIGQRQSGEVRALRVAQAEAAVSALVYMPGHNLIAAGSVDGSLLLIDTLPPGLMTGRDQPADDLVTTSLHAETSGHRAAVVSLAAPADPAAQASIDLVSLASDRSLKAWRLGSNRQLSSLDLALPKEVGGAVVPGGLEVSARGETVSLRTSLGDVYVARLPDDGRPRQASTGAWDELRPQAYRVQISVGNENQLDAAARRTALRRLRDSLNSVIPQGSELFDEAKLRTVADAIDSQRSMEVLSDITVDSRTASALEGTRNPLLSLLPSILLQRVALAREVTATALSRDGLRVFAAGVDCTIREVDLRSWLATPDRPAKILSTLSGHGSPLTHLSLSPDNQVLAAGSLDGRVRMHNLAKARFLSSVPFADLETGPPCPATQPVMSAAHGVTEPSCDTPDATMNRKGEYRLGENAVSVQSCVLRVSGGARGFNRYVYRIENVGSREITNLRWDAAGVSANSISPKQAISTSVIRETDPAVVLSEISASSANNLSVETVIPGSSRN